MREYQKGDVVRLKVHMPADTVRGVKRMEAGWEFKVMTEQARNQLLRRT